MACHGTFGQTFVIICPTKKQSIATKARAACATGPVADKFQAAGSEPPSELLEATVVVTANSHSKVVVLTTQLRLYWYRQVIRNFLKAAVKEAHFPQFPSICCIYPSPFRCIVSKR